MVDVQPRSIICPEIDGKGFRGGPQQLSYPLRGHVVTPIWRYGAGSPVELHLE